MTAMSYYKTSLSEKNPFRLEQHRYLELVHYCLQYPEWKKKRRELIEANGHPLYLEDPVVHDTGRSTEDLAIRIDELTRAIDLVECAAKAADQDLWRFLLCAVTKDVKYPVLRDLHGLPCCKNVWYRTYRKFYWILSQMKGL